MAIEVALQKDAPEFTTVASYEVTRLTGSLFMRTTMTETRRGWVPIAVLAAVDANADGVFEELHVQPAANIMVADPAQLVGRTIVDEHLATVGVVGTAAAVAAVPASPENPTGTPGYWTLTLTSGGLASAAPVSLQATQLNPFGIQVQNPANGGRSWQFVLSSDSPAQLARMESMLANVQAALVAAALTALGVTKTPAEIQAAVGAMFAAGASIDSLIASEMEKLEEDRRSGAFTGATVLGSPPAV